MTAPWSFLLSSRSKEPLRLWKRHTLNKPTETWWLQGYCASWHPPPQGWDGQGHCPVHHTTALEVGRGVQKGTRTKPRMLSASLSDNNSSLFKALVGHGYHAKHILSQATTSLSALLPSLFLQTKKEVWRRYVNNIRSHSQLSRRARAGDQWLTLEAVFPTRCTLPPPTCAYLEDVPLALHIFTMDNTRW